MDILNNLVERIQEPGSAAFVLSGLVLFVALSYVMFKESGSAKFEWRYAQEWLYAGLLTLLAVDVIPTNIEVLTGIVMGMIWAVLAKGGSQIMRDRFFPSGATLPGGKLDTDSLEKEIQRKARKAIKKFGINVIGNELDDIGSYARKKLGL